VLLGRIRPRSVAAGAPGHSHLVRWREGSMTDAAETRRVVESFFAAWTKNKKNESSS
jgi:hypothetical protein